MSEADSDGMFRASGDAYEAFMGRYSSGLAPVFADAARVVPGATALDVGCGPGALTGVLVARLGATAVAACDPSQAFLDACAAHNPGVDTRLGRAEAIPFETDRFDHSMAQLVLHFVSEPHRAADEMVRVVRPGGTVSACVWDFNDGMVMLRRFWDAALAIDPNAPDEAQTMRFGGPAELVQLLGAAGLEEIEESVLHTSSDYTSFEELWAGFLAGVGPAGSYCAGLTDEQQSRLRSELFLRLGSPRGRFTLGAAARCAVGRVVP